MVPKEIGMPTWVGSATDLNYKSVGNSLQMKKFKTQINRQKDGKNQGMFRVWSPQNFV